MGKNYLERNTMIEPVDCPHGGAGRWEFKVQCCDIHGDEFILVNVGELRMGTVVTVKGT